MNTNFSKAYRQIDIATWKRKEHFEKWMQFDEPFHGVVVSVELTKARLNSKNNAVKLFDYYMFHFIAALNECRPFKYRLIEEQPVELEEVFSGLVVLKPDETFAYGHLVYTPSIEAFQSQIAQEKERIIARGSLHDRERFLNITHFSVLPWTDFLSLSHARKFNDGDSIPKITFGKISLQDNRYSMPMAVHVHHALVDGKDVAEFINRFQERLDENLR